MSIDFFEGFETVGTELGLVNQATTRPRIALRWDETSAGGIPSSDSFFLIDDFVSEGYAIQMGSNNFSSGNKLGMNIPAAKHEAPGASARTWILGARVHIPITSVSNWNIFLVQGLFGGSSITGVIGLQAQNGTDLVCLRADPGAFTIATAASVLTPGAWHYVEFKFKIAESADGGFVQVYLDGSEVIANTAADTNNALTTAFSEWQMENVGNPTTASGNYVGYDDIYLVDTSVSPHTDFLTPVRVRSLPPNSDVLNAWDSSPSGGTNYERVDENGADASDLVETDVDGVRDRYGITNLADSETALAVKMEAEVINQTGGSPSIHLEIRSGTSTDTSEHVITSTTAYEVITLYADNDPAGGAWTNTAVDAVQAGYLFKNNVV